MILSLLLSLLNVDACKIHTLYIADPDRAVMCPADQAGPMWPWEVPPEGQRPIK